MKRPLFAPALIALLLSGCAAAPVAPPPEGPALAAPVPSAESALDLDAQLPFDPAVIRGRLDNGLSYFIRQNGKPEERADLWLVVNAGSLQETEEQRGLAHFVEHMAFNGTENFAKQELVDFLERIGMRFGPDVNAFTSFDETVYMLRVPTDDPATVDQAFQILEDWAHGVSFEDDEIDKERGVVIEEWRLGRGASARIRDQQFPVLFQDSRYAERLPIGKVEVLESAPADELRSFYRSWYRPDLMAVVAVGDFDPDDILRRIEQQFGGLESPEGAPERQLYPVPDHQDQLFSIATDPEATSTLASVYTKLETQPRGTVGAYRQGLLRGLYFEMLNGRLDELRRQADPPFLGARANTSSMVRTKDVFVQTASVEEGGVERGLEALLSEVERVDRYGFTEGELERAKADILRLYERAYNERDKEDSGSFTAEYMRHFLTGESAPGIAEELRMVRELLPGVSLEELNRLADEWITDHNRVVLVSAPEKAAPTLPDSTQLAALLERVDQRPLDPYLDRTRDTPLLAAAPEPGRIVERRQVPEIGVTEWRLANGVRVVLKPTDFRNDQVLLGGFSPGGHSLVEDRDYPSAQFADTVASLGGRGEFSSVELRKALAGKAASAGGFIDELSEGVSAQAAPEDLETMFQLLYLSVTSPRRDEEAFAAFMTQARTFVENRLARPEAVFSDAISRAQYGDHPRRQPLDLETVERIDLDRALQIYRERFADAGDFTFLIVGNFEPQAIEPLVETYLGGLPATGRQESWRDLGIETPSGVRRIEVRKGLEPKSLVQVAFEGPAEWSRENLHDIGSLAAALRIRLREVLREDMGGTYGVRVNGSLSPRPEPRYSFSIGFGCDPAKVDQLLESLFGELETVIAQGLDASYVEKVREIQRRSRETNLQENSFWLGVLQSYYDNGWDPRLIMEYEPLVERVTSEQLRQTAERYLDLDDYLLAVLYPEAETETEAESATGP